MKSLSNKNIGGFTLIELLVVVLIIGILASIALPSYTRAVEKSRLTEAEITLKALGDAKARCMLATGESINAGKCGQGDENDNNLFTSMDIELPYPQTEYEGLPAVKSKNFVYYLDGEYLEAERLRGETILYCLEYSPYTQKISCTDYEIECKTLGYTQGTAPKYTKP